MTAAAEDPHEIIVHPDRFREHLELLARTRTPVPLGRLVDGVAEGRVPPGAIGVTFDDGYADNALEALPLLEEYGVPATIFVATEPVGTEREFWWDALEALWLRTAHLPERLTLPFGWRPFRAALGDAARYPEAERRRHAGWSARDGTAPTPRHDAYLRLFRRLMRLAAADRRRVLDRLHEWAGRAPSRRTTHRALSERELGGLARHELIDLGGHTDGHPALSRVSRAERRREIEVGRRRLEALAGPVRYFAYPFGDARRASRIVRSAGFEGGWTTRPEPITARADRYRMPRMYVGDWSATELERRLGEVAGADP